MKLGASLVQLYSSFTYQGPYHIRTITLDLMALIQQQGFRNISEVIGQHSWLTSIHLMRLSKNIIFSYLISGEFCIMAIKNSMILHDV